MAWDPARYLRFADERTRPGVELMARIPDVDARRIVDLGSGTGRLTALLADRWPDATVVGVDSSPEMLAQARNAHPDVRWVTADIAGWQPDGPVDIVFSNAALHWLDDHEVLFPRLRSWLPSGGVLAVQMPANWDRPTHRIPAQLLDGEAWPPEAGAALLRDRLAAPADYARWLQPARIDMWHTTYFQRLSGDDAVWEWTSGSLLAPVLDVLDHGDAARFGAACRDRYARAYPPSPDGTTMLPFSRFFVVAIAT